MQFTGQCNLSLNSYFSGCIVCYGCILSAERSNVVIRNRFNYATLCVNNCLFMGQVHILYLKIINHLF